MHRAPANFTRGMAPPMDKLCNARNVLIEMCDDRGYEKTQEKLPYNDFVVRFPNATSSPSVLNYTTRKPETTAATAAVVTIHFTFDEKLSKAVLEKILSDYSSQGISRIILVTLSKLNPSCKALLSASRQPVETFLVSELQANISRHELVVPHRLLGAEEAAAIKQKYRVTDDGMPVILTSDVMSRYIGAEVGDVVEITRSSLTVGRSHYYRIVRQG